MKIISWLLVIYFFIGIGAVFFLKQTPYADNPLWAMILLWPLYFF